MNGTWISRSPFISRVSPLSLRVRDHARSNGLNKIFDTVCPLVLTRRFEVSNVHHVHPLSKKKDIPRFWTFPKIKERERERERFFDFFLLEKILISWAVRTSCRHVLPVRSERKRLASSRTRKIFDTSLRLTSLKRCWRMVRIWYVSYPLSLSSLHTHLSETLKKIKQVGAERKSLRLGTMNYFIHILSAKGVYFLCLTEGSTIQNPEATYGFLNQVMVNFEPSNYEGMSSKQDSDMRRLIGTCFLLSSLTSKQQYKHKTSNTPHS